jgi:hypothetical protein
MRAPVKPTPIAKLCVTSKVLFQHLWAPPPDLAGPDRDLSQRTVLGRVMTGTILIKSAQLI